MRGNIINLFPDLESVPEVEVSDNMIDAFIEHLKIEKSQKNREQSAKLLASNSSRLFRYLFAYFMKGSLDRNDIAIKTGLDMRVVSRYLNSENLARLFYMYDINEVSESGFFEQLKREFPKLY